MQNQPIGAEDRCATPYVEDIEVKEVILQYIFNLGHPVTLEEVIRHFAALDPDSAFGRRDGIERAVRELEKALRDLADIQTESDRRRSVMHKGTSPVIPMTIGVLGFESLRTPDAGARPSATMRL